jgi:DNA-binding protein YbaB
MPSVTNCNKKIMKMEGNMSNFFPWLVIVSLVLAAPLTAVRAQTDETQLKIQIKLLKERIEQMQKQEQNLQEELAKVQNRDKELSKQYIKVELRGNLREKTTRMIPHVIKPGIAPPTVSLVMSKSLLWELDFGDNKELLEKARKFKDKNVVLSGTVSPPSVPLGVRYPPPGAILVVTQGVGIIQVEAIDLAKD